MSDYKFKCPMCGKDGAHLDTGNEWVKCYDCQFECDREYWEQIATLTAERDEYKAKLDNQWMPISTAVKEHGKKILCYGEGYVFEAECEYDDGYGWWCSIGGAEATHWMPLPPNPTTGDDQ